MYVAGELEKSTIPGIVHNVRWQRVSAAILRSKVKPAFYKITDRGTIVLTSLQTIFVRGTWQTGQMTVHAWMTTICPVAAAIAICKVIARSRWFF